MQRYGKGGNGSPFAAVMRDYSATLYLFGALLLLVAAGTYLVLDVGNQVWTGAREDTANLAAALQSSASAQLQQSAGTLRAAANDLDRAAAAPSDELLDVFREATRFDSISAFLGFRSGQTGELTLIDHEGRVLPANLVNPLRDQIEAAPTGEIRLQRLIQIPGRDAWYIPVTLGIQGGRTAGTAIALVSTSRLLIGSDSLRVLPDCWINLHTLQGPKLLTYSRTDNTLVPNPPSWPRAQLAQLLHSGRSGNMYVIGRMDGRWNLIGWSVSDTLPFYTTASIHVSNLYLLWLKQASAPMIMLMLGGIGVVIFGIRLRREVAQREQLMRQQQFLARHDTLTGLLNRAAFMQLLEEAIQEDPHQTFAVVLLDLNNFKDINDTLGHAAGDRVLQELGQRLTNLGIGEGASIARLGGDEVAVLWRRAGVSEALDSCCERLQRCVRRTILMAGVELDLTASIGSALYPQDATTPIELLRCADIAMYSAKNELRPHTRYSAMLDSFTPESLAIKSEFARALHDGGLSVVYQPKVRLADGALMGIEALSRWIHPSLGSVPPTRFIPLAESTELIHEFTQHVLQTAIEQVAGWRAIGASIPVSVNISANNLLDPSFVDRVARLLESVGLPAHLLELEITENAVMRHPETMLKRLQAIRDLGVKLAIDDFGTGYASLAYLKQLPVHALKIDKAFVVNLASDQADQRIVRSSIQLAHEFGMAVVAEGVESEAIAERLREYACDHAQGFHFSPPLTASEIELQWLAAVRARARASGNTATLRVLRGTSEG